MPLHWMTPEESAEFDKKHPLDTMLIFSPKQTSAYSKWLKQQPQNEQQAKTEPKEGSIKQD